MTAPKTALPPAAFSPDGYIVSQEATKGFAYGRGPSDVSGCGWIAAFNLLRAAGGQPHPETVSGELAATLAFHGRMGTGPRPLRRYLEAHGFCLHTAFGRKKARALAAKARMGIFLYLSGAEPHYVAFTRLPGGGFRFFNAIDGEANHTGGIEEMLTRQVRLPFVWLMAVL